MYPHRLQIHSFTLKRMNTKKKQKKNQTSGFMGLLSILLGEPLKLDGVRMSSIPGLLFSSLFRDIQSGSDRCQAYLVLCFRSLWCSRWTFAPVWGLEGSRTGLPQGCLSTLIHWSFFFSTSDTSVLLLVQKKKKKEIQWCLVSPPRVVKFWSSVHCG